MFLQSEGGITEIFPAVPDSWKDASFSTLRAEGGFLISAKRVNGKTQEVDIEATQNGRLVLVRPFQKYRFEGAESARPTEDYHHLNFRMKKGEKVRLVAIYD
jgi:alpha-L-fucosidase 2